MFSAKVGGCEEIATVIVFDDGDDAKRVAVVRSMTLSSLVVERASIVVIAVGGDGGLVVIAIIVVGMWIGDAFADDWGMPQLRSTRR